MNMKNPINQGTNNATMLDWLNSTRDMNLTTFDPSALTDVQLLIEPDQAVNLSAADRARMNRARPGVHTPPEHL
jgi:hypothetical protein